jgi:16S rRNA (cytosine967-C5)-methyltransferase
MAATDPRELALDVLLAIESQHGFSDAVLSAHLNASDLGGADRRLAAQLVYGTLARRLTLDHTIDAYSSTRKNRLETTVRELLRLGLFQTAFLERIPSYAAVDSTVRLAKARVPRAAGFVNAILRRASRDGLAPPPTERERRLAVEHSHPTWLVHRWIEELGERDTIALMAADNDALPTVLRVLIPREAALERLAEAGIGATPCRLAPDAVVAAKPVRIAGLALPQNEASQLVVRWLCPQPGGRVLDAGAAPGGKTAYIAALVGAAGSVTALDPGRDAEVRIDSLLTAAGVRERVRFHAVAVEKFDTDAVFDAVLVDAPCSGLGTLSEHPEIRWRRSPKDISALALRQRAILAAAARAVRPGGVLLYSTCTLIAEENDEVVDEFLLTHEEFHAEPGTVSAELACVIGDDGRLRTLPHRDQMPGFFAARLRRRAGV